MGMTTQAKRAEFRRLHEAGCFVIPNPWDIGSARYLEQSGFKALASTSSGLAWSMGRPDNAMHCDEVLAHLAALVVAIDLPINADFEHGYSDRLDELGANVSRAVETGICGLSIEDSTGDPEAPLFEIGQAIERIKAARTAIDRVDPAAMLIGRAEGFLVGQRDNGEITRRLKAYADAGADCLYAPGLRTEAEIAAVVAAVAPKPVNVLAGSAGFTVAGLAALGVRRISVGGALARSAWTGFMRAAKIIVENGSFEGFRETAPFLEIDDLFASGADRND
jgi:2-methylisocitrate lyase-like PEP mutase family enzyme